MIPLSFGLKPLTHDSLVLLALLAAGCVGPAPEPEPEEELSGAEVVLEALTSGGDEQVPEGPDEEEFLDELARLYEDAALQESEAPDVDQEALDASYSPYQEFGPRIVVYHDSGFVMKPFSFPVGMGKKAQQLAIAHGGFAVHGSPVDTENFPDPTVPQPPDSIVLHLMNGYDAEAFVSPRGPNLEAPTAVALADWLIVTARPAQLRRVQQFLNAFLADVRQIEVEAKIVEVVTSNTFDYGIRPVDDTTPIFGLPNAGSLINSIDYSFENTVPNMDEILGEAVFGTTAVFDGVEFNALLEAVETDENVAIISRPKVAVREGGRADIVNMRKVPFFTLSQINANGNFTSNLTYKDVGVQMYVAPRVIGRNTIIMNVDIEVSEVTGTAVTFVQTDAENEVDSVITIPEISRRRATTTVRLEQGQAVILGGLISERKLERERKVPVLGDIPLLGYLFKSKFLETRKTNVLFFIRPRILQGIDLNPDF